MSPKAAVLLTIILSALIAAAQPRSSCTPPPADLVAWWPFDADSRAAAEDIVGNHHTQGVGLPRSGPGRVGSGMTFATGGSRFEVVDHDQLDLGTGDFSIDFWLRTSDTSALATIIDKRTLQPRTRGFSVFLASGKIGVQLADGSGALNICSADSASSACTNYGSSVVVADGAWHLVAVTVDRDAAAGGRIYIDGKLSTTFDPRARRGSLNNGAPLLIGASNDTIGTSYRGTLDEVELFRRALTPVEVRRLYTAGTAGKCKPRVIAAGNAKVALNGTTSYRVSFDGQPFSRPVSQRPRLELRYKQFDPVVDKTPAVAAPLRQNESEVVIVQFVTHPLEAYRRAIESLGGTTYTFIPDQALLVRIRPSMRAKLQALPFVRWVGPYHPAYKLEEVLRERLAAGKRSGPARYNIQFLERGDFAAPVLARTRQLGGKIESAAPQGFRVEATLDDAQLLEIARMWQVLFIDRWFPIENDMDIARQSGGADHVLGVRNYSGQGVRGEVMDDGLRTTHAGFAAMPAMLHGANSTGNSHGTQVFGTIFGSGATAAKGRGVVFGAQGIFASYTNLTNRYTHTAELIAASQPWRASFQSNSWGNGLTTAYSTFSAELDDILFLNDLLVTHSQSNTGTKNSRPQAWSKNVVSVGGLKHFDTLTDADDSWSGGASIGPAADGRIKPDLSHFYDSVYTTFASSDTSHTPSFNGTSAATPITAGHFGLLFQMWADGVFAGGPGKNLDVFASRPHATTAKALMINGARQYPFTGAGADRTRVHQGWGRADAGALHDLARADGWKLPLLVDQTRTIAPFGVHSFSVNVPGNVSDTLWLKATLVYPDPAGSPSASKARVNDLTLRVTAPDGTVYFGNNGLLGGNWSTSGGVANDVDTVENVFIPDGPPGAYTIDVLADAIVQDGNLATTAVDAVYSLVVTRALGSCTTPPGGMVGWWPFDGSLGTVTAPVADIQAGHDAQPLGTGVVERIAGVSRQGGWFRHDEAWVEAADDPALDIGTGDFTIDAWYSFPPSEVLGTDDNIVVVASKLEGDRDSGPLTGYELSLEPGATSSDPRNFHLILADGTKSDFASLVDADLQGWHHIAVTVDRDSTSGGRFYLDGVELTAAQFDPTVRPGSISNNAPLRMGRLSGTDPWALDEVEIFNRVLSDVEIAAIYQAGSQGKCKPDLWVDDTPVWDTSSAPDTGEEPDPNMSGKAVWASRSMWVHPDASPCASTTHTSHGNPEYGSPNTLCVEVKNRGGRPGTAIVDTYFAAASTGLAWTPNLWTPIGTQSVTVPASGTAIVEIPWNNVPDPQSEPNGHFCLVTRLVSTEDPMTFAEGTNLAVNVTQNNNIAWRNVNVVNLAGKTEEMVLVRVRNVRPERGPVDLAIGAGDDFIADGGTVVIDLGPLFALWRERGARGRNVVPLDGTRVALRGLPASIDGLIMAPGEEHALAMTAEAREPMPRDGKSHQYRIDVVEFIGGEEIGGVSYNITTRARGTDTDGDGAPDIKDSDDDNDGVPDSRDNDPLDACTRKTVLRGLHYKMTEFPTCAAATAAAVSAAAIASPRYTRACSPTAATRARVASCAVSPPLSKGWVVVDVEVCCK